MFPYTMQEKWWMPMYAPDGGDGAGATDTGTETQTETDTDEQDAGAEAAKAAESAEIARLKAELAKQKASLDKATKEAGDAKKALRAHQSAEEAAAEAEKERQEAIEKELAELRKERAVAVTSKKVFTFVQDENVSNAIAGALYGAEDIDAALTAIQKAWTAREKALKMEYGRIPAPGIGSAEGTGMTRSQLDTLAYKDRLDFKQKHPDEYERLMGR